MCNGPGRVIVHRHPAQLEASCQSPRGRRAAGEALFGDRPTSAVCVHPDPVRRLTCPWRIGARTEQIPVTHCYAHANKAHSTRRDGREYITSDREQTDARQALNHTRRPMATTQFVHETPDQEQYRKKRLRIVHSCDNWYVHPPTTPHARRSLTSMAPQAARERSSACDRPRKAPATLASRQRCSAISTTKSGTTLRRGHPLVADHTPPASLASCLHATLPCMALEGSPTALRPPSHRPTLRGPRMACPTLPPAWQRSHPVTRTPRQLLFNLPSEYSADI